MRAPFDAEPAKQLVDRLACPRCHAAVQLETDSPAIVCPQGHRYAFHDGYLDASAEARTDDATTRTLESFGFEWTTFDDVRDEDDAFADMYFRDLDLGTLEGRIGLDAGCGKGRYTRYLAPHLGALVALDGSAAVESAVHNLRPFGNVLVVRADLRAAPLGSEAFDFVSSLGVLHHLDDPQDGFNRLAQTLAPGGTMLLYLYSRPARWGVRRVALAAATALRRLTVRMPHRALRAMSYPVAWLLYATFVLPGSFGAQRGIAALERLPMATYRRQPVRSLVLDTFDRLSAPVENRYLLSDIEPWFPPAGMEIVTAREEAGWFVVARKHD